MTVEVSGSVVRVGGIPQDKSARIMVTRKLKCRKDETRHKISSSKPSSSDLLPPTGPYFL